MKLLRYGELGRESLRELSALAERVGMEGLQAVNRRALELQERDRAAGRTRGRINFGVYFFRDVEEPDEEDPDDSA